MRADVCGAPSFHVLLLVVRHAFPAADLPLLFAVHEERPRDPPFRPPSANDLSHLVIPLLPISHKSMCLIPFLEVLSARHQSVPQPSAFLYPLDRGAAQLLHRNRLDE